MLKIIAMIIQIDLKFTILKVVENFFPDTNFSIDSFNDFKRVKEIFNVAKLKPGKYDYKNIFSLFNKKNIY